jgi:lycopene beta-cyclase
VVFLGEGTGLFESIVYKQWDHLKFYSNRFSDTLSIAPYRYKMIRGLDFYQFCFDQLKKHPSVTFLQGKVEKVFSGDSTGVIAEGKTLTAEYVFNSIPPKDPELGRKDIWLLQHFKGWLIETAQSQFTPEAATLMDFRIPQEKGTAFCYVLPLFSTKALVEYTLFTPSLLKDEEYDAALKVL